MSLPKILLVGVFAMAYAAIAGYWLGALVYRCG